MCYNGGMDVEVDGILVAAQELKEPLTVLRQLALSFDEMKADKDLWLKNNENIVFVEKYF